MRSKLFLILMVFGTLVFGQYENDWIDYSQEYFKIKIVQNGFYRVTATQLEGQGFPTSSVPSARLQLFRKGEEVAIQVNSSAGILNYFEFYGEKNNGEVDTELYLDPDFQPHTEYSLFTDTATYFLTWKLTAENGKRMAFSALNDPTGLSAETFHMNESIELGTSSYSSGLKFGSGSSFALSDYDNGEGWTGAFRSKGAFEDYSFNLSDVSLESNPVLELALVGGNSLAHNVDVLVGPSTESLRNIGNIQFSDRTTTQQTFDFLQTDIHADGTLIARVNTTGFDGASDRVSTALVRVLHPQTFNLGTAENKIFDLQPIVPSTRAYVQIATINAAGTSIYDITDPYDQIRLSTTNFSNRLDCIVSGSATNRTILAVTNFNSVADIQTASFHPVSDTDFVIITHPQLRQVTSDGLDPIQAYINYRSSLAGGNVSSQAVSIFQLFDQFNYGDASPAAIRHFAKYLFETGSPESIFLVGKGRTTPKNFYRTTAHSTVNIPTYGDPGGDLLFTRGLGSDPMQIDIPIGRLNAFTSEDVKAYLDKVKEQESRSFDDLTLKNILQLSGGQSASELSLFRSHLNSFSSVLENDFLGGKAINYGKETSEAVEVIDVVGEVNAGLGFITFFGHSSGTVSDIEIGRVSDPRFGFANPGKYPMMLVNGCNAGDIFGTNFTFGEDWMNTPNLGAVAVIAHAFFAYSANLKRWSDIFYKVAFAEDESFGWSIGDIIQRVSNRYIATFGSGSFAQTQVFQILLQGDPMLKVFGAESPDYEVTNEDISVTSLDGDQVFAIQNEFQIQMIVRNYGKTVTDSLLVQVRRTLPQGTTIETFQNFKRVLREDTLTLTLYNENGVEVAGTNTFEVFLDHTNSVDELNEGNNYAFIEAQIFKGNTTNLSPPNYAVQSNLDISFYWQPTDLFEPSRSYFLEIDTTSTFNSTYLKSLTSSGEQLLKMDVNFSQDNLPDSTVIFWRTRFENPQNTEEQEWENSSFTFIENVEEGWGQFSSGQFVEDQMTGIAYGTNDEDWDFVTTDSPIDVITFGSNFLGFNYDDLRVLANGIDYLVTSNTIDPRCRTNTINALVFDKESTNPYRPISINKADVFNNLVCGRLPQMVYNLTEKEVIESNARLEQLISLMSTGDHILLFNIGSVNYSNWDSDVLTALENVGVSNALVGSLIDGQPVIILGKKGDSPGSATAVLSDGSVNPLDQQSVQMLNNVAGSFTSGKLTTDLIGPAKSWNSFEFILNENPEDISSIRVIGVQNDATEVTLLQNLRGDVLDLSSVDASMYPRIKLEFSFEDDTHLTPAQLGFWMVNYDLPPEGILLTEKTESKIIQEGQTVDKKYSFFNYSSIDFTDSLDVNVTLRSNSSGNSVGQDFRIGAPLAGDTTDFEITISTIGQTNLNSLFTMVTPMEKEQYAFNNQVNIDGAYDIQGDETNPIIEVTIDGEYVMNGDIISPNPTIVIRMKDDNTFLLKNDTLGMDIQWKMNCEGCVYERINFTDPSISFVHATENSDFEITFTPGSLEDGTYSLSTQARDESGNPSGDQPYELEFEVVTTSSITHFYPYPNPFSTQTRFVFTLTGSTLPDRIKIQIMTISGRIVRELNQNEIGPIKIGNNITEYAWNGTDEFGDQLANGVYFYRVLIESDTDSIEHRSTSGDGAFKDGFGKLYILR